MSLVNYTPVEPTEAQKFAAGLAGRANQVAQTIVQLYRANFEMLWYREGWDVSNVQAIADEMGTAFTQLMIANGALGQLCATVYPGQVPESELASPVSYTVNPDGTIKFDANGTYPGPQRD
jgi:hypothetical protein